MSKSLECPECSCELFPITGLCTDRDNMRSDQYCPECEARYGLRSHGLVLISKSANTCEILKRNKELELTIKTMMGLKSD